MDLFADDFSLFLVIEDPNSTAAQLCNDLCKLHRWPSQWKVSFNPNDSEQDKEVIFSRKYKQINHPTIYFNDTVVNQVSQQQHLGLTLGKSLSFEDDMKRLLSNYFHFLKLSKLLKPHLNCGNVIFDKALNPICHWKLQSLQYNDTLAIKGAIKVTFTEKINESWRWLSMAHLHYVCFISLF